MWKSVLCLLWTLWSRDGMWRGEGGLYVVPGSTGGETRLVPEAGAGPLPWGNGRWRSGPETVSTDALPPAAAGTCITRQCTHRHTPLHHSSLGITGTLLYCHLYCNTEGTRMDLPEDVVHNQEQRTVLGACFGLKDTEIHRLVACIAFAIPSLF